MIVAPFIRKNALLSLLKNCENPNEISVITRWTGEDIVSGVSDLDVYPLLKEMGFLFISTRQSTSNCWSSRQIGLL